MLTRQDLNDSLRETVNLMKLDTNYYLSNNAWHEVDKLYEQKGWVRPERLERIIKSNGYLTIYWNNQQIYQQNIGLVDIATLTLTDVHTLRRAFAFTLALTLRGAFAFALVAAFAFALLEGNITEIKDSNNLLKYRTIKEEEQDLAKEKLYLDL